MGFNTMSYGLSTGFRWLRKFLTTVIKLRSS